jgi:hypothetical protein
MGDEDWQRYRARWSGAEAALVVAWALLAAGLLGHALVRDSIGVLLLALFAAWQMTTVWSEVHAGGTPEDRRSARRATL